MNVTPYQTAPAGLKFLLVTRRRTLNPLEIAEWTLHYRLVEAIPSALGLQQIRVRGVLPRHLVGFRVGDPWVEAFALETQHDAAGRSCSAGEMMAALYGVEQPVELRLPATDFVRPVQAVHAVITLRVLDTESLDLQNIAVLGFIG